ncbi:MAG: hypothetical protein ABR511_04070 [Acidimicrobiales bacterium]
MIRLDAATVLLQWATGGLAFLWVTTRRREVGIGYGWLMRIVFGLLAAGSVVAGRLVRPDAGRDALAAAVVAATIVALVVSVVRRKAGVAGERARRERKAARVAAMVAGDSPAPSSAPTSRSTEGAVARATAGGDDAPAEFPPALDLVAPALGVVGLVAAALADGGPHLLAVARTLVGAAFLGSVTDAMLLGHWYLVQPGLGRAPLFELNRWLGWVWPAEVAVLLWPTGMVSVLMGTVDDGWHGTLGWFWVACALATVALVGVTHAALKEKSYSAVMAATGLLYLAILTAFGTDLVARAVLAR